MQNTPSGRASPGSFALSIFLYAGGSIIPRRSPGGIELRTRGILTFYEAITLDSRQALKSEILRLLVKMNKYRAASRTIVLGASLTQK